MTSSFSLSLHLAMCSWIWKDSVQKWFCLLKVPFTLCSVANLNYCDFYTVLTVWRILSFNSMLNLSNWASLVLGLGPSMTSPKMNFSLTTLFTVLSQKGTRFTVIFRALFSGKPSSVWNSKWNYAIFFFQKKKKGLESRKTEMLQMTCLKQGCQ